MKQIATGADARSNGSTVAAPKVGTARVPITPVAIESVGLRLSERSELSIDLSTYLSI